jgi:protein ImuB
VFEETCELEYPVENLEPLAFLLNRMLEQLCARLRARSLATNEVRLTCELDAIADVRLQIAGSAEDLGQKHSEICNQKSAISDRLRGEKVFARSVKLPVPIQDARVLLKLLQLDLAAHPPGAPIAKLALRAEPVKPRATQDGFFIPVAPEPEKLELLLARAAAIVGEENIGAAEVLDSHRPDAHRMKRFSVFGSGFPERATGNRKPETGNRDATRLALRLFRPPLRARVEVQAGKPVRVSFLEHARAEVTASTGPWRTSGEWWTNDGWQRDEWDVSLQTKSGTALYRLYRDIATGDWFVYGSYD